MTHPNVPTCRDALEIQRAHDILTAVITELPLRHAVLGWNEEALRRLMASADALCWVLGHEHNQNFAERLVRIEADLAQQGLGLVDTGTLQTPAEGDS
jgi:hypothetical protein